MTSTVPHSTTSEAPADRALAIRECLDSLDLPDRRLRPEELEQVASTIAERTELWKDLVVDSRDRRWWLVLQKTESYEVRLLSWEFDQSSDWHDHGGSSGGFVVTEGVLNERCRAADAVSIDEHRYEHGAHGSFGPAHLHDVRHEEGRPAVSIHAYSPPLSLLTMYDVTPYGFVVRTVMADDQRP